MAYVKKTDRIYKKRGRDNNAFASHQKMHGQNGPPIVVARPTDINQGNGVLKFDTQTQMYMLNNAKLAISKCDEDWEKLKPLWQEKKEFMEEAQRDFKVEDEKRAGIDIDRQRNKAIIVGIASHLNLRQELRLVNAPTFKIEKDQRANVRLERGEKLPPIKWIHEFDEVLTTFDRFLTFQEMWNRLVGSEPWVRNSGRTIKKLKTLKGGAQVSLIEHCKLFRKERKKKDSVQVIVAMGGKYGRVGWVDVNGKIKDAKHLEGLEDKKIIHS